MRQFFVLAVVGVCMSAQAQVYRCGDSTTYTDKPCEGAEAIDLRSNILQPGPQSVPEQAPEHPAPAIIMKDTRRVTSTPASEGSSIWQRKDARDSEATNRTTGPLK